MITLDKQLEKFDNHFDMVLNTVRVMTEYDQEAIRKEARERLILNYAKYGDLMWTWDSKTRWNNIIQELADAVNYELSNNFYE